MILSCVNCYGANPDQDIFIIYTNDVHCSVNENIGYAGLQSFKKQIQKLSPYVALVDAGDWSQGEIIGPISQGRYIVEIMNVLNYDVAVPGNHEFDYGWSQFLNFSEKLKCGFISCNLKDLTTDELVFKPYKIFNYGNIKIAFVGICTPESLLKSTPSTFMNREGKYIYDFCGDDTGNKLCASIQKAVDDAKKDGADFVIAVCHLGEKEKVIEVWSAPFIAAHTKGIDAFIDGHSREEVQAMKIKNADGKETIITQTGARLNNIGLMKITTDGEIKTELIDHVDERDEEITALIENIKERYQSILDEKLSFADFTLRAVDDQGKWLIRNNETGLCDLITDAILDSTSDTMTGKADIALFNAGGIRANIESGEILYSDVLNVLPFNNTVCIIEASGQTILDELEMGVRLMPNNSGGLLHVAGLTYMVDINIPSPVKIDNKNRLYDISEGRRVFNVVINGKEIDPKRYYKIASTSYTLRSGGDGHLFTDAVLIEPEYSVAADVLAHYIKKFTLVPEIYDRSQERMKVIK